MSYLFHDVPSSLSGQQMKKWSRLISWQFTFFFLNQIRDLVILSLVPPCLLNNICSGQYHWSPNITPLLMWFSNIDCSPFYLTIFKVQLTCTVPSKKPSFCTRSSVKTLCKTPTKCIIIHHLELLPIVGLSYLPNYIVNSCKIRIKFPP